MRFYGFINRTCIKDKDSSGKTTFVINLWNIEAIEMWDTTNQSQATF